jgi:outer membrane cobalamin receptor
MLAKHHCKLEKLIQNTKQLNPTLSPITYSETLIYTDDIVEKSIAEHLSPIEIVTREDISRFFAAELKSIREML